MPKELDEFDLLPEPGPWPVVPAFASKTPVAAPILSRTVWLLILAGVATACAGLAKVATGGWLS